MTDQSIGIDPAALAELVRTSCTKSGVPERLEDTVALGRVAELLTERATTPGSHPGVATTITSNAATARKQVRHAS